MKDSVVLLAFCCVAGIAQDSINTSQGAGGFRGSAHFGPQPGYSSTVTGEPYCGEVVSGNVQTLADGTHIAREAQPTKVCRDSFGRTRQERSMFRGPVDKAQGVPDAPTIVEISDPVAHVSDVLDIEGKVAHRRELRVPERARVRAAVGTGRAPMEVNRPPAQAAAAAPPADPDGPQTATEKLEPQVIEGVPAEGRRVTTTWPEGSRM